MILLKILGKKTEFTLDNKGEVVHSGLSVIF